MIHPKNVPQLPCPRGVVQLLKNIGQQHGKRENKQRLYNTSA